MTDVYAIIPAAGSSRRMEGVNKLFIELDGQTVLARTVRNVSGITGLKKIVLVCPPSAIEEYKQRLESELNETEYLLIHFVPGGASRQVSVGQGVLALDAFDISWSEDYVLIHDAARCLLSSVEMEQMCAQAYQHKAVTAALPLVDTIKKVDEAGVVSDSISRDNVWCMQTPQIFQAELIKRAHLEVEKDATDDVTLVQEFCDVYVCEVKSPNYKLTRPQDENLFEALLKSL